MVQPLHRQKNRYYLARRAIRELVRRYLPTQNSRAGYLRHLNISSENNYYAISMMWRLPRSKVK
jgi:hypothetical protein